MPKNHKVKQGDCLSSIAKKYGFPDYKVIWDDGANAELKQKRKNPNLLFPGDIVVVPDLELKQVDKPTEQKHNFVLDKGTVKFQLIVKDDEDKPYANCKYDLKIDGKDFTGTTDGSGKIEQDIPADASNGEVAIYETKDGEECVITVFKLELGHLDPVEEATGVQARLNNLGFFCGKIDGIVGPLTQEALKAFQEKNGLSVTGAADQATKNKLAQLHDWE
jgi:N-acetylmuramoyl-L-alanine amidase